MKYGFARFYLAGLLVCAVILSLGGVIGAGWYWYRAASARVSASVLRTKAYVINTESVVTELSTTVRLLGNRLGSSRLGSATVPTANGFGVAKCAELRPESLVGFQGYLNQVAETRDMLKVMLGSEIERSLRTLIAAAEGSLPKPPTREVRPARPVPIQYGVPDRIYDRAVLTDETLGSLRAVSEFLGSRVTKYTPSRDAQRLADSANTNLQTIIDLMVADLKSGFTHDRTEATFERTESIEARTPSEREALIVEFIRILEGSISTVKQNGLTGWRLDSALENAHAECIEAIATRDRELAALRGAAWTMFGIGWIVLLSALLGSLLLMVVRDFMAAVIDTAANTREMSDRLSSITAEAQK